ncbi:hypothetical protein [Streptomyces ziwulingensis]|uniref:TetR family transcriptional regulator n=1 Tax=Streptomyces ziwulingensis TaxID=1045501 RepID=A0ABP9CQI4_9ACTN
MGRISAHTRTRNERAVRDAMERILSGCLGEDPRSGLKTLADEAGVPRSGFYPRLKPDGTSVPGPYQHLATEFARRLSAVRAERAAAPGCGPAAAG